LPPQSEDAEAPIIDPDTGDYTVEEKIRRLKEKIENISSPPQLEPDDPQDEDFLRSGA
jgi:hypothetical protein